MSKPVMISHNLHKHEIKKELLNLFDNENDRSSLTPILDINLETLSRGASKFQIENFILNKKENTNDLFLYNQIKLELFARINMLFDLQYQYKKTKVTTELIEAEIEELQSNLSENQKIKNAKIKLKYIEIEKNNYQLFSIKKQATDKLNECKIFHNKYEELKYIENLSEEQLQDLEEEGWKIKSAYFAELRERYLLTPDGFLELPHQNNKGLTGVIEYTNPDEIRKRKGMALSSQHKQ